MEGSTDPADYPPEEVYWDPRHKRYFFKGTLPPFPGYSSPTLGNAKSRASAEPKVEVYSTDNSKSGKPPILVTEERRLGRLRDAWSQFWRKQRRISWTPSTPLNPEDDADDPSPDDPTDKLDSEAPPPLPMTLSVQLCALVIVLAVAVSLLVYMPLAFRLRGQRNLQAAAARTSSEDQESEAMMDVLNVTNFSSTSAKPLYALTGGGEKQAAGNVATHRDPDGRGAGEEKNVTDTSLQVTSTEDRQGVAALSRTRDGPETT